MSKYYYEKEEIWPHFEIHEQPIYRTDGSVELSSEFVQKYTEAYKQYETLRRQLRDLIELMKSDNA